MGQKKKNMKRNFKEFCRNFQKLKENNYFPMQTRNFFSYGKTESIEKKQVYVDQLFFGKSLLP